MVNPRAAIFVMSCRSGEGVPEWVDWLLAARSATQV